MFTCQNMGNVAASNDHGGEEWLEDLKEESQFLDFSRKVNHSQFLKVRFFCFADAVIIQFILSF